MSSETPSQGSSSPTNQGGSNKHTCVSFGNTFPSSTAPTSTMKFKTHLEAAEHAGKTHLKTLHPDLQPIIGDAVRRIFQTHATCSHRIKKQRQMKSTPDYLTTSVKNVNFVLQATAAVKESEDHVALEARLQSEMDVFRTKLMREYVLPHEDIKLAAAHKECVEAYVDLIILAAKCFIAQHDVPKYDEFQATGPPSHRIRPGPCSLPDRHCVRLPQATEEIRQADGCAHALP